MWSRLIQIALCSLLLNSIAAANELEKLDGDWYSFKWKYGYSLSEGKGVAFATNSPNFKVGQEIVRLSSVGKNTFVGENIYKDGKFYKVKATLQTDGKLLFEGEKNVKWEMERIDPETYSSIVNSKPEKQANKKDIETGENASKDSLPEKSAKTKANSLSNADYLSEKYGTSAMVYCSSGADPYLRTVSKYSFKWDDISWYEQKFDSYLTNVREPGIFTAVTDKVSLQNGFGAYQRIKLYCNYDVEKKKVLSFEIREN
jgi:hypothetical protein